MGIGSPSMVLALCVTISIYCSYMYQGSLEVSRVGLGEEGGVRELTQDCNKRIELLKGFAILFAINAVNLKSL